MDKYLTPPQVAKLLGTDAGRVLAWIRAGKLQAFNLSEGGRPRWKVSPTDLQSFLQTKSNQVTPPRQERRSIAKPAKIWV